MKQIRHVMECSAGAEIGRSIYEAIAHAATNHVIVEFEHNGRTVVVDVKAFADDIYFKWEKAGAK